LQSLYAAITAALLPIGYQPEPRPFRPHITLARCQSHVPRLVIDEFLQAHATFVSPEFPVTEFVLYSSELKPNGSVYRRERVYPLV
jgi:2'-5' RNA ligase